MSYLAVVMQQGLGPEGLPLVLLKLTHDNGASACHCVNKA